MYAIVKTGGKQYKVAPGDKLNVEKLPGEAGDKVTLDAICIVDGKKVEADPSKAAGTKVEAVIVEQFRDKKILVFKFKKRKNYKRLQGHRQDMTRIQITSVGSEKFAEPAAKKTTKKAATKKAENKAEGAEAKKPAAKAAEAKKPAAKAAEARKPEAKAAEAKKTAEAKKPAAKKTTKADAADEKATEE